MTNMSLTDTPQIAEVTDFKSVREDPSRYPADITTWSFVSDGKLVYPITFPENDVMGAVVETVNGNKLLDAWLKENGEPGLDERFAFRAYAANRNPRISAPGNKMPSKPFVPTIMGESTDLIVAYQTAGRFGYMFGGAMEHRGARMTEAVNLLALDDGVYEDSQVHLMDRSEPNFERRLDTRPFLLVTGQPITNTMIYAGKANMFKGHFESPVALPNADESLASYESPIGIEEIPFEFSRPTNVKRISQGAMLDKVVEQLRLGESRGIRSGTHFRETANDEWLRWKSDNPETTSDPEGGLIQYTKKAIAEGHSVQIDTSATFPNAAPQIPSKDYTLDRLLVPSA